MTMNEWHYADLARVQHGPVDVQTVQDLFARGDLTVDSLVWRPGMVHWQSLSSVAAELGLAAAVPAVPAGTAATATPDGAAPGEIVYAGFWKRVAASCIDSLALCCITVPIGMVAGAITGFGFGVQPEVDGHLSTGYWVMQAIINLVSLAISASYYAGFHASRGMATLGKKAIGIKVVRSNGERISLARAIGRFFALYLSMLTLYIGLIMAAFTRRKQALHDIICDTVVVDRWAFTEHPERQRRELGTPTIVILCVFGLLTLAAIAIMVVAIAALGTLVTGLMHA